MKEMHELERLRAMDVNLLVAFDLLTEERSVTRAARRAGVTQSAMSHTLRRLREQLGDPLMLRGEGGMVLTPRAEALVGPVRRGLFALGRALIAPSEFDPSTSRRRFTLVGPDLFETLVSPRLYARLAKVAPHAGLTIFGGASAPAARLESGELDLAVVPAMIGAEAEAAAAGSLRQRVLFRDRLRCFVRRDHGSLGPRGRLTRRALASLPHVMVSPSGQGAGPVDAALAAAGLSRHVAVRVPRFAAALAVVAASDLVLTAPSALAACSTHAPVRSLTPPLSLPEHAITMVWHPRFHEDPAHRLLREVLVEATRGLGVTAGPAQRGLAES